MQEKETFCMHSNRVDIQLSGPSQAPHQVVGDRTAWSRDNSHKTDGCAKVLAFAWSLCTQKIVYKDVSIRSDNASQTFDGGDDF